MDDIEDLLERIEYNPYILKEIDVNLLNDKEFIIKAVQNNSYAIHFIPHKWHDDADVIRATLPYKKQYNHIMRYDVISEYDKASIFTCDRYIGMRYASDRLLHDKRFAMDIVRWNGGCIQFFPDEFRDDEEIMYNAIKKEAKWFSFASFRLRNNREFVLKCVWYNEDVYRFVNGRFRDDTNMLIEACTTNASYLMYANQEIIGDTGMLMRLQNKQASLNETLFVSDVVEGNKLFPMKIRKLYKRIIEVDAFDEIFNVEEIGKNIEYIIENFYGFMHMMCNDNGSFEPYNRKINYKFVQIIKENYFDIFEKNLVLMRKIYEDEDMMMYLDKVHNIKIFDMTELDPDNEYSHEELVKEYNRRFPEQRVIIMNK
eukprot:764955-Hanusia_phi.AAC.8